LSRIKEALYENKGLLLILKNTCMKKQKILNEKVAK